MNITDEVNVKLDANGDIPATGDLEMNTGLDAVAQGARSNVKAIAGEWFDNLRQGVKWFEMRTSDGIVVVSRREAILGSKYDPERIQAELRAALVTAPGVLAVKTFVVSFDSRTRTVDASWVLSTVFGDTPTDRLMLGGRG